MSMNNKNSMCFFISPHHAVKVFVWKVLQIKHEHQLYTSYVDMKADDING